eukprot:TRINITY_DN11708_c0_g1_i4.p1 TRINITY_DN11708_c0_g1~~TRINITY_DN11708_c0_g1_i4.p1  ORF type:complete len:1148 (-),score=230.95 TRINITY_DN11708_c0_g1_i4:165-3608(-)
MDPMKPPMMNSGPYQHHQQMDPMKPPMMNSGQQMDPMKPPMMNSGPYQHQQQMDLMKPPMMNPPKMAVAEDPEMVRWSSCSSIHLLGSMDVLDPESEARAPMTPMDKTEEFQEPDLLELMQGYKHFGLHKYGESWKFCEWLPKAKSAFLIGEFNAWDKTATPLKLDPDLEDVWTCKITGEQAKAMKKGTKYKLYTISQEGQESYPTPAWATRMVFTKDLNIFDAVVWPVEPLVEEQKVLAPKAEERIYECHLGLAFRQKSTKSFDEARQVLIDRCVRNGYTALLVHGIQESKEYSNYGAKPVAYFAPTSCLGPPEALQAFIKKAHEAGLRVYMSIAHDGAAGCVDGLAEQFFRSEHSEDPVTGARIFNYDHPEVARFLLCNLCFWMSEYGFDGFQFPRVDSMIYTSRGRWLPEDPFDLDEYVQKPGMVDESALHYLRLVNAAVDQQGKTLGKIVSKIACDSSLYPGLCKPLPQGIGFDFRKSSKVAMFFRQLLKNFRDEEWSVGDLLEVVSMPRAARLQERVLACTEAPEQCVVSRKPLKIAMLAWETLHTIAVGGVAPHVTELSAALHGAGHEVHIFTRAQGHAIDHEIMGVHYHEVHYDTSDCMVTDIRNMCGAFVWALKGHENTWGCFDVIHGHDWLAGPAVCELKTDGKRVVFTMHSTEGGRNGDMNKGHPGIKEIEKHGCAAAERLICVSGVLKDEVCGCCHADGGKIHTIYNGIHAGPIVNMEWREDWTGNTKADKGWSPMDPMFLFVGRHTAQKGCDILIEAIPQVLAARGDAKFVIVGDGHLLAANQGRARALGLDHAVSFTGSLKSGSTHLKSLFKACDAVVVPSRNEPFGIVVLEAWAAGKPVVATTSGGPRDFVKPGEDGYLVDPMPESVAWGCKKILENFEHARWMGKNAQAKALREFSWEHIAHETEQVYYTMLGLQGAPRSSEQEVGYSLACKMLSEHGNHMSATDSDPHVARGIALLKMLKMLIATAGGDGIVTWMGTEFGQLEACDMPRPGNGFNEELSRVKYELADSKGMKYSDMQAFEADLNSASQKYGWLSDPSTDVIEQCENLKVIAYVRRHCVFVFNFHASKEHRDYVFTLPRQHVLARSLSCILHTSGQRNISCPVVNGCFSLSIPPRTALILTRDGTTTPVMGA